jgi:hypothetical protein
MRKTLNFTVTDEGRDKDKVFVITEMSASQAESWAIRALLALMNEGTQLPEGFDQMGMAGMAEVGVRALSNLRWETAKPLLDEMFACVKIMPDPKKPKVVRDLEENDIEEVVTRFKLRKEVFNLHAGFFKLASPSA